MQVQQTTEPRKFQDREVTPVYTRNVKATKPVVANVGGADSSKSHSLAQLFIGKMTSERNKTFLICRKTRPSLKLTAYRLVIDLLKLYGFYRHMKHNKSDLTFHIAGLNNFVVFASIDDPEKYKSAEFNYIWMEEANDFTWEDFIILKLRLRAKTTPDCPNRMYLSFNPSEEQGWIKQRLFKEKDVEIIHSTYLDNRFAAEIDIKVLEGLRQQDEAYWLIYAKGEFARVKGQIHQLFIVKEFPECPETIYGEDFGFVHPNVLLKIGIDMENLALYVTELLYQTGMTNAQLKEKMKQLIPEKDRGREIYADSAEPARIEEIYHEGFNIHSSDKSVIDGIDCVNRFKIFSREENVNFNDEMHGYKRKTDRKGQVLEEPVKFRDHGPNALRYAVFTHLRDRLLSVDPAWTVHSGQKKAEPERKKGLTAQISEEEAPPEATARTPQQAKPEELPPMAERKIPEKPFGNRRGDEVPAVKKRPEKKGREDEAWVI